MGPWWRYIARHRAALQREHEAEYGPPEPEPVPAPVRRKRPRRGLTFKALYIEGPPTGELVPPLGPIGRRVLSYAQRLQREAVGAVNSAIARGKLFPEPCKHRGSSTKINAHHTDYQAPLLVVWLCRRCHVAEHVRLNKLKKNT